jgi:phosphopantothenoylcysteine synthetase/decarboxylase
LDAAWPHIALLLASAATSKELLLAAIDAVATIRPREAGAILADLADSEDEEIAEAVDEAMSMAEGFSDDEFDDEFEDEDDEDDEPGTGKRETIH